VQTVTTDAITLYWAWMKNTAWDPGGFKEQKLLALPGVAGKLNLPLCSFVPGDVSASSDGAGKK